MEASRWGGRTVLLSILSMLLIVASLVLPYYEVGNHDAYLINDFNSGPAETLNQLAGNTLRYLVACVFLSLIYIACVMKGIRWPSFYLGGAACEAAILTAIYFAFEARRILNDLEEHVDGALSGGFAVLLVACAIQFVSVVMRGWILGGHAEKRRYERLEDGPTDRDDAYPSSILPK